MNASSLKHYAKTKIESSGVNKKLSGKKKYEMLWSLSANMQPCRV